MKITGGPNYNKKKYGGVYCAQGGFKAWVLISGEDKRGPEKRLRSKARV